MTTKVSQFRPIQTAAGVDTNRTPFLTPHYTASSKIRFVNGYPRKIGGWQSFSFADSNAILGVPRSIFSVVFANRVQTLIGTHTRLYNLSGSTLTNITPVKTTTVAVANSLATLYGTLANNPITTVNGSKTLTIADTSASRYRVGDSITLSGASTTNGVPNTEINATHLIRAIGTNTFDIIVTTAATSSGTGGGGSVVRATKLIEVTKATHGLTDGDRVKIAGAAATGGITAVQINVEHIIRVTGSGTFDVLTAGTATSSVSSAGGASTTYQQQIDAGEANESFGQGYGAGLYGVGLYGTALTSSSGRDLVRIWFMDRFGDLVIATPGGQTGVYQWDGNITTAPVLVTNAPTAVNYAFVSDNILVTFGASGVENKIKTSDQGAITTWTASSTNSVFEDDIEGAGRLISHVSVPGNNLIFTEQACYTFRKVPRDSGVWEIKVKDPAIGIIAPMARVTVNGVAYWMGASNFYMWRGGNVEIIPSNSPDQRESTILRSVFDNLNTSQLSKIFCWHNEAYNEIWWHYPSASSNEIDSVARLSLRDFSWCPDTFNRTAAEYPNVNQQYPKLANSSGTLYRHEIGTDDDGSAMTWSLTTNLKTMGKDNSVIVGFIPDSDQSGDVTVNITAKRFPQSTANTYDEDYTVTASTERVPTAVQGRFWSFTLSGSAVGQDWSMGQWLEELQPGAAQ